MRRPPLLLAVAVIGSIVARPARAQYIGVGGDYGGGGVPTWLRNINRGGDRSWVVHRTPASGTPVNLNDAPKDPAPVLTPGSPRPQRQPQNPPAPPPLPQQPPTQGAGLPPPLPSPPRPPSPAPVKPQPPAQKTKREKAAPEPTKIYFPWPVKVCPSAGAAEPSPSKPSSTSGVDCKSLTSALFKCLDHPYPMDRECISKMLSVAIDSCPAPSPPPLPDLSMLGMPPSPPGSEAAMTQQQQKDLAAFFNAFT